MRGYLDIIHYTRLVEDPPGVWTPCCSCGPLDAPQEARHEGLVLLEDHERYVRHVRQPDHLMSA